MLQNTKMKEISTQNYDLLSPKARHPKVCQLKLQDGSTFFTLNSPTIKHGFQESRFLPGKSLEKIRSVGNFSRIKYSEICKKALRKPLSDILEDAGSRQVDLKKASSSRTQSIVSPEEKGSVKRSPENSKHRTEPYVSEYSPLSSRNSTSILHLGPMLASPGAQRSIGGTKMQHYKSQVPCVPPTGVRKYSHDTNPVSRNYDHPCSLRSNNTHFPPINNLRRYVTGNFGEYVRDLREEEKRASNTQLLQNRSGLPSRKYHSSMQLGEEISNYTLNNEGVTGCHSSLIALKECEGETPKTPAFSPTSKKTQLTHADPISHHKKYKNNTVNEEESHFIKRHSASPRRKLKFCAPRVNFAHHSLPNTLNTTQERIGNEGAGAIGKGKGGTTECSLIMKVAKGALETNVIINTKKYSLDSKDNILSNHKIINFDIHSKTQAPTMITPQNISRVACDGGTNAIYFDTEKKNLLRSSKSAKQLNMAIHKLINSKKHNNYII